MDAFQRANTDSPAQSTTDAFRSARDRLLGLREDYARAVEEFRWPEMGERFNWAVDWFDAIARGNDTTALAIVEEDGRSLERSFDEMSRRSDQVAAWLAQQGVGKGDSVIVMLGNQVELWEAMLGIMKVGAVIMPTTTALGPADLNDRIDRGAARHVICNPADAAKFDDVPGDYTRIAVGPVSGTTSSWVDLHDAYALGDVAVDHPGTRPQDRLLLYFTSGTTSKPKLVEHTQVSYPVGHLSTMYWVGVRPGDVHLTISSPGWAKHAWSLFFAPWIAEATIFVYNYTRFDAPALLE
ncbi:MAG TPA: AMP-binding protein, partial [Nocardioidaceae bacterium]